MKRLTSFIVCALVFLTGCATAGSQMSNSVTKQFVASQETMKQVQQLEQAGILSNVTALMSEPAQVEATGPEKVLTCLSSEGGVWLQEHNECENMPQKECESLGGEFNECASACRNDADADACIMMCVQVCQFSKSAK